MNMNIRLNNFLNTKDTKDTKFKSKNLRGKKIFARSEKEVLP
jgi:hypothetical protein